MDSQNTSQSQLEVHIAELQIAENLDEDGDVDIIFGSHDDISDSNTIVTDDEIDDIILNASDAFKQFKALLQNSINLVDVLSESAKLMDMLTLGCDKGSITMDHKFKSRTEQWFTVKTSGDYSFNKMNTGPINPI